MSITFQPDREGILYVGTRVSLVCLTVVTVDTTIVDTDDFTVDTIITRDSVSSPSTMGTISVNNTASQGIVDFALLLPSDDGGTFECVSTLQPVGDSQFLVPATSSYSKTLTLDVSREL